MSKYIKETSRIDVKFIDADTDTILFEVRDRNWMNIGDMFSTTHGDSMLQRELKGKKLPKKILVMAVSELTLVD